ncbi:MAG TPA: universal stress protein [Gemmatimonadales bacterium]
MFTRLLIGLDGSPRADEAFEQAVLLGRRFSATLVAAHVREPGAPEDAGLLDRAAQRARAAGLTAETWTREGDADLLLAELAKDVDAVLVGRRGSTTTGESLGPTVASLIRIAERCVIVCGSTPSPMRICALAYDGGETSKRALELAARFASITGSSVHLIHAAADRAAGTLVVGPAEALLSFQGIPFVTHIESGKPGAAVAAVIARVGADALFAGAHVPRNTERPSVVVSHAEEILRQTDLPVVIQP